MNNRKKKNPRDDRCRNLERKLNWSYKNESHQQVGESESMECINVYEKLELILGDESGTQHKTQDRFFFSIAVMIQRLPR